MRDWLDLLFASWLFLAVLTPEDVYRTFFHALIYSLSCYVLVRERSVLDWKDPFLRAFLVFCGYMAATTWLVGDGPVEGDFQALRWGFEAALGMLAFWLWMSTVTAREALWGRVFLATALFGSLAGLLLSSTDQFAGTRLAGVGAMGHPIQGASIAIVLMAVGLFLTFQNGRKGSVPDTLLALATIVIVCHFVILSKSRAPAIALLIYLILLTILCCFRYRAILVGSLFFAVTAIILGVIHWFVGLSVLFDQLLARGASYRVDIWWSVLAYPPESLLLGNGAGLDFKFTEASRLYLEPKGLVIFHPHNIWLGAFSETGLIGVVMQAGLVILPMWSTLRGPLAVISKLHLLGILGLFLMLTFTDEHTLLMSLHPIWILGWIPLLFVWTVSRRQRGDASFGDFASAGGER